MKKKYIFRRKNLVMSENCCNFAGFLSRKSDGKEFSRHRDFEISRFRDRKNKTIINKIKLTIYYNGKSL